MNYEKELAYLRKEFKKSEDKFREAEREGYEADADIWQDDMVNIGHQIHIHEQAAKADEYEAKSQAFDEIVGCLEKQVAYGLKDSEVLSEIDYLIRETFHNSKNNIYRRTEERSE